MATKAPHLGFVVAGGCAQPETAGNFYALGAVSDRALDLLYRAASSVIIPLTAGGGTSLKLVEAMAYAKPTISTSVGSRGHSLENGKEVIISDDLSQFPLIASSLAERPDSARDLCEAARRYALQLDFRETFAPYGEAVLRLLNRPQNKMPGKANPRGLVVIDNNLTSIVGHHFTYAETIVKEAQRRELPCRILANKGVDPAVSASLPVFGTFSQGVHQALPDNPYEIWDDLAPVYDFLGSNHKFYAEFCAALEAHINLEDIIFIPNATHRQVLAVAAFLSAARFAVTPKFVLLFRYEVFFTGIDSTGNPVRMPNRGLIDLYMMAFRKLEAVATTRTVRLVTDSKDLSAEFQQLTNIPFEVLPIPHATGNAAGVVVKDAPPKVEGVLRVVFLGDAREEKGFRHFAPMLKEFLARGPSLPVQFVLQAFVSSSFHAPMAAEIETLKSLGFPQLSLIERPLPIPEYNALLESADLVLLPYNPMVYTSRTSGPFVEAISHGKPVIVSENSWLSRQLGNSGAGVTFKFTDPKDFLRATFHALANLGTLSDNARRFGAQVNSYHNPRVFLDQLME